METKKKKLPKENVKTSHATLPPATCHPPSAPEHGGRGGLDPTRFGDWEIKGRCVDF